MRRSTPGLKTLHLCEEGEQNDTAKQQQQQQPVVSLFGGQHIFFFFHFFVLAPVQSRRNRHEVIAVTLKGKPNTSDAKCFYWDFKGSCGISRRLAAAQLMLLLFFCFLDLFFQLYPQTLRSWDCNNKNVCMFPLWQQPQWGYSEVVTAALNLCCFLGIAAHAAELQWSQGRKQIK